MFHNLRPRGGGRGGEYIKVFSKKGSYTKCINSENEILSTRLVSAKHKHLNNFRFFHTCNNYKNYKIKIRPNN